RENEVIRLSPLQFPKNVLDGFQINGTTNQRSVCGVARVLREPDHVSVTLEVTQKKIVDDSHSSFSFGSVFPSDSSCSPRGFDFGRAALYMQVMQVHEAYAFP